MPFRTMGQVSVLWSQWVQFLRRTVEVVLGQLRGLNQFCSWFTVVNMLLLGKAAKPCPGRPCQAGLVDDEEDDEDEDVR